MMATAFMGYVLPWGQMSFWGATVITNLFSALNDHPARRHRDRDVAVGRLLGVGRPTLNRFFSLHYLLPFVIVGLVVPAHLGAARGRPEQPDRPRHQAAHRIRVPMAPYCRRQGRVRPVRLPDPVRLVRVLPAGLPRSRRQLHRGQSAGDPAAHRAGMVLPAVLRDPARHPVQARRRRRHVRFDRGPGFRALARYQPRPLGASTGRSTAGSSGRW